MINTSNAINYEFNNIGLYNFMISQLSKDDYVFSTSLVSNDESINIGVDNIAHCHPVVGMTSDCNLNLRIIACITITFMVMLSTT